MSRNLSSWEKDPFFSAAEQVQDSADRLESAHRALLHAKSLSPDAAANDNIDFCRRELSTAFGIAKWQLEEFEKEVSVLASKLYVEDNVSRRHKQFVEAVSYQLSSIRDALLCSQDQKDRKILTSVSLGQKESDELAHFLCGTQMSLGISAGDTVSSCSKTETRQNDMATSASLFSTSSGIDGRKRLSGSLDECTSYQETCTSSNTNDHVLPRETWILERNPASIHDVCTQFDNHNSDQHATALLLREDCHDDVKMGIERTHGNNWAERTLDAGSSHFNEGESRIPLKHALKGFLPHTWPSSLRAGLCVGSGVSQSVLKRFKDGEGDPLDLCQMCDDDIETSCSSILCQRYKGYSELQSLRTSQKVAFSKQLVQKIIMILAILGVLWLYLY